MLFVVAVMATSFASAVSEPSGPRSHVFVLHVGDDDAEDVLKILDSLRRHRGWNSAGLGFDSQTSSKLAAECCELSLRRFDPTLHYPGSIRPEQYPTVDRNLSLLVPDRPDPLLFVPIQPPRSSTPELSSWVSTPVSGVALTERSFEVDTAQEVTGDSAPVSGSTLDAGTILFFSLVVDLSFTQVLVLASPEDSLVDWVPPGSDRQVVRATLRERLRLLRLHSSSLR